MMATPTSRKNSDESNSSSNAGEDLDAPHRVHVPPKHGQKTKGVACTGVFMLAFTTLMLIVVVGIDIALETNILVTKAVLNPAILSVSEEEFSCSPMTVNLSNIEYHSRHRYYSIMKELDPPSPPLFRDNHTVLCNESLRSDLGYGYCLPISGRKDAPFCTGADRMDLLTQHSRRTRCYASVLHMLLVEIYEELQAYARSPALVFGSLLGAVRNGSMIPFTEDTDIAYSGELSEDNDVGRALMQKGYHFFHLNIWRVCVAPTHPLAAKLYEPTLPITEAYRVPYLDLYAMEQLNDTAWSVEGYREDIIPADKVKPFSQVIINGLPFDTVHDPNYFLVEMYGDDFMVPKPRG
ncbi:hypothetical protein PF008_g24879 [Phytophthora fragariae]|uniref:LicD family protein n=1 Tax=Phytophthora fragariae TaxID=53985 RepID=A0A6G0QME8_9STRA|nr:hypothetical protein PF008_g24879 [Phytophthora fragariae]